MFTRHFTELYLFIIIPDRKLNENTKDMFCVADKF